MAAASQSPAKNCLINQSCQTEWDDQHYWSDRLQSSNNHDNSFESDCFSAHSIPVSSNNERKSTTEHKDTTQQSHYKCSPFSSITSSVSSLHAIDEMEFQENLALLDQRINSVRESLRKNSVI
ncbi:unnamed protein product [Heterobilharzia americana]|nr:unnamed protein product [Heterobilharzia americana]